MWKSAIGTLIMAIAIGVGVEKQTGYVWSQIAKQLRAPEPGSLFAIISKRFMNRSNQIPSQQLVDLIHPSPGSVLLEIGPGFGFALEHLFANYQPGRVYGVELSEDFFQGLRTKFAKHFKSGQLVVYNQDAKDLSFFLEDNSVDAIYALNVIYFLNPLPEYLQEFYRVLKPGGKVVFGVYEVAKTMDPTIFVNRDWDVCLEALKQVGFEDAARGQQPLFNARNGPQAGTTLTGTKPMPPPPPPPPPVEEVEAEGEGVEPDESNDGEKIEDSVGENENENEQEQKEM